MWLHFGIFVTRTNFAFIIDQQSVCIALTFLSRSQRSFVTKISTEHRDILIGDLKIVHLCLNHYISPKILSYEVVLQIKPQKFSSLVTAGVAQKRSPLSKRRSSWFCIASWEMVRSPCDGNTYRLDCLTIQSSNNFLPENPVLICFSFFYRFYNNILHRQICLRLFFYFCIPSMECRLMPHVKKISLLRHSKEWFFWCLKKIGLMRAVWDSSKFEYWHSFNSGFPTNWLQWCRYGLKRFSINRSTCTTYHPGLQFLLCLCLKKMET